MERSSQTLDRKEFEKTHREFQKKLIKANKCIIGNTYYLTGLFFDYGDVLILGVASALSSAFGNKIKVSPNYKRAKCLINTSVKFVGKGSTAGMHMRKAFIFVNNNGEEIRMFAYDDLFREKQKNKKPYFI